MDTPTCRISDTICIGGDKPVFIMGPCVIESEAHALSMAERLALLAQERAIPLIFKASFDKANRTSIGSFRGPGLEAGLAILARIKAATGLAVTTDIHDCQQIGPAAEQVDLLQIPAFLCRQTDLIVAAARSGRPVSIKKGQWMAPWDCRPLVEKFHEAGGRELVLMERGTSFGYNTLVTDFRGLPQMRALGVPVVFDGTHSVQAPGGQGGSSGGQRQFAPALMRAALAVGVEGVFIETHDDPASARSDGPNMIPLAELPRLLDELLAIDAALGRPKAVV